MLCKEGNADDDTESKNTISGQQNKKPGYLKDHD